MTQPSPLLKDALYQEGSSDQADLLTGDAALLTLDDIIDFLNGAKRPSEEVRSILSEVANRRIAKGQPLLPWGAEVLKGRIPPGPPPREAVW